MPPKKTQKEILEARRRRERGELAHNRKGWVDLHDERWVLYVNKAGEAPEYEELGDIEGDAAFLINERGGRMFKIPLTKMTTEELVALRTFFLHVFDVALPLVQQRDKDARDAYDKDGSTHFRLYRRLPQLVVVEGDGTQHLEGILFRPQPLPGGVWPDGGASGGVRGPGDGVAPDAQVPGEAEDDGAETDQSA